VNLTAIIMRGMRKDYANKEKPIQDGKGPVFLMNVTSVEEARALLGKLPLVDAKLMEFDFIELGPLSPLHLLLSEGWAIAGK
jgi:hypothetical protein